MSAADLASAARVKDFIADSGGFDLTCTENDRKYSSKSGAVDFFTAPLLLKTVMRILVMSRSCFMAGNTVDECIH